MESTLKISRRAKPLGSGSWDKQAVEVTPFNLLSAEMFIHGRGTISSMFHSAPARLSDKER